MTPATQMPDTLTTDGADARSGVLQQALAAIAERGYWSRYPESPSPRVYGETAATEGKAAFEAYLGQRFPLEQPGTDGWVSTERNPYGFPLEIAYPHSDVDTLLAAAQAALPQWRQAGPHTRVDVCQRILDRLHEHVFELAYAVQFTTGQAFVMAFQAGGPHALDRGLEAVAYAYREMTRQAERVVWRKPAGRGTTVAVEKRYHIVPRGVALVIGCNTFPTWNAYPGLFASLATGNPVVIKPHPRAVLPLAITVRYARQVLTEAGFDPNLVTLAAQGPDEALASMLATRPEIRIIDYTGSTAYGQWLESHARQARVYTEKAGVNFVVIDSTDDVDGMFRNLAFSLTLYSGQMCTTPQNILIPRDGITTPNGRLSFAEVTDGIVAAVTALTREPARAVELTGAIVNEGVLERLERAATVGEVLLASRSVKHPQFTDATVRTPLIVRLDVADRDIYTAEWFGPISFMVSTDSTEQSLAVMCDTVREHGALTASVYATDPAVLEAAEQVAIDSGVHLSCNLTGGVFVNQSAAFSDFHATGANPAANATLVDAAFVADRFRVVQSRYPVAS